MFVFMYGSFMSFILTLSGIFAGLSISMFEPSVSSTSYITDGDVVIRSILNSLSILSCIISKCSSPKNPHLNPNPSACDVSGSNSKAASFSFSFSNASLSSGNLLDSIGYIPQNTIGFIGLYPCSGSLAGLLAKVIVSPTFTSLILLILADNIPTSPATNSLTCFSFGVQTSNSTTSYSAPVAIIFILSPTFILPFTTLSEAIIPLYESK